jgi:hypothetical protein
MILGRVMESHGETKSTLIYLASDMNIYRIRSPFIVPIHNSICIFYSRFVGPIPQCNSSQFHRFHRIRDGLDVRCPPSLAALGQIGWLNGRYWTRFL